MSLFNLHIVWLKLLLPWRLFRFWSLLDGIDPPENMIRCVSDSFSTVRFWRAWHRSFNKWIVRYLYVPLGGSGVSGRFGVARTILNYLVVFTFVALWHDISLNLLVWGWLIVLFMLPEIIGTRLFPRSKWENNLTTWRMLCAAGSVLNVIMMMSANLVGFAVGVDGLKSIIHGIFSDWGGELISSSLNIDELLTMIQELPSYSPRQEFCLQQSRSCSKCGRTRLDMGLISSVSYGAKLYWICAHI